MNKYKVGDIIFYTLFYSNIRYFTVVKVLDNQNYLLENIISKNIGEYYVNNDYKKVATKPSYLQ